MTTTIRIQHPRRSYPTLQVFIDAVLVFEQDVYKEEAAAIRDYLAARTDEIVEATYGPAGAIRRLIAEATR